MSAPELLAIDWGTTNRRVYLIGSDDGVLATEQDDRGVLAMTGADWPAELAALRARFGDLPALLVGMAGSTRGWTNVRYMPPPVGIAELAADLCWVEPRRTAIVPGVGSRAEAASDVIRGEETQFLGAVAAGLVPADALLVQPGTHCKWARIVEARITDFRTAMTGELFALLRDHSLLGDFLKGPVSDGPAFRAGLALAGDGLTSALFGERARVLLGRGDESETAARVSGLLIGADVAAAKTAPSETAYVLADSGLGALYMAAITAAGARPVLVDSRAAFTSGVTAIWRASDGPTR